MSLPLHNIASILKRAKEKQLSLDARKELTIQLAEELLQESLSHYTKEERRRQKELAKMMQDPKGKVFTTRMIDECFRSHSPARVANQLVYLLQQMGLPEYVSLSKKIALSLFKRLGEFFPSFSVTMATWMLRKETASVILPGEKKLLLKHMQKRRQEGVRLNINHLGEAILGEEEAMRRLHTYLLDLQNEAIEYVSVKISTLFSQINLLAWEETKAVLASRLRELYRAARDHTFIRPDGVKVCKFVNLDMEEYKDLRLTVDLFQTVLEEEEFHQVTAGIVLQAYLPDSYLIQQEITKWAQNRVKIGGAPIKIRIVKGANLAMEKLESSLKGWPQAPYHHKIEVDANYRKMVEFGSLKEHIECVELGIASHNLFDIAYALILRAERGVESRMHFEMLEGMAEPIRIALQKTAQDILLYCPVAKQRDFQSAVAYLIRRLDENTGHDNFLRSSFGLKPKSPEWDFQAKFFLEGCLHMQTVSSHSHRIQNRWHEPLRYSILEPFKSEADTDFSLLHNREWIHTFLEEWKNNNTLLVPCTQFQEKQDISYFIKEGSDPSCPQKISYRYATASWEEIDAVLERASLSREEWTYVSLETRCELLAKVSHQLQLKRGYLIGVMVKDGGKTILEADSEVSEAVDFAEYYLRSARELFSHRDVKLEAKGAYLITPPWNFPVSIAVGGILSALIMGNTVIFKPAPETTLIGWVLINILWEAGISKDVLYWIVCEDEPMGTKLIQDPRITAVVLTGATATAKFFLNQRPGLDLSAETGGKNGIIVTNLSDRDLAISSIIQSAFGHAGQKCSAASLLVLEQEVYDDPHFKEQLKDAVRSLKTGSSWDPSTKVVPLIREASSHLEKALTTLEIDESWLLKPVQDPHNPLLWSPGIKWGVKEGSFMHQQELFGPVLAVMRAENLDHAINIVNQTPYGLTSGLFSLDPREQEQWLKHIQAGNCYINRTTTGAIVLRQPFGGCKCSQYGSGKKAGGPNYLVQFVHVKSLTSPQEKSPISPLLEQVMQWARNHVQEAHDLACLEPSLESYTYWSDHFTQKHEMAFLIGQDNLLTYKPYDKLCLRIQVGDLSIDILRALSAALLCKVPLEVSFCLKHPLITQEFRQQFSSFIWKEESENVFLDRLYRGHMRRVIVLSSFPPIWKEIAAHSLTHISDQDICSNGRFELLRYLQEVAISHDYHRYGNLGLRENERKKEGS
ncbi:proline dehydrogenase family protein [Rhabdochlamydiaceae symbiont of Dictyostelium giganteum]|uniref:proline dehydrogenase family protein n=1 Tax=Rhabdochlamydiaceae symbiont of Dictyostelium giganteum TaxID=3342349 RepID=UPI00384D69BC